MPALPANGPASSGRGTFLMVEKTPESPLQALGERLKKAREAQTGPSSGKKPVLRGEMSGFGQALRVGAELISALLVGVGIGWFLDAWLGTKPWMLILFIFLGGAAGILNVYRTAMAMAQAATDGPRDGTSDATDENSGTDGREK